MRKLCLVSCILSRAQDYVNDIPQQRLVFFVQHLVGQLETNVLQSSVAGGQVLVVLSFVLPAVKEIYGPFWSTIVDKMRKTGAEADLYALHASLRLLNLLRKSYMLESNDDLLDAWSEKKPAVGQWLVGLLWDLQGKRPAFFAQVEAFCHRDGYNTTPRKDINLRLVLFPPLLMTRPPGRIPR